MGRTRTEIRKSAFINPQDLFLKAIAVCWANTISMHFSIPSVFPRERFCGSTKFVLWKLVEIHHRHLLVGPGVEPGVGQAS